MTVSNNWLVNVQVGINTAVVQIPTFNNCLIIGVFSNTYKPGSWTGAIYQAYTSLSSFNTDFSSQLAAAITAGDLLQANRLNWLINDVTAFFAQSPTPSILYVAQIVPQSVSVPNYTTDLTAISGAQNNWYGFTVADKILPDAYSTCIVSLTVNAATTVPAGTVVTPETASASYTLLETYTLSAASYPATFTVPFYSTDATTAIPMSTFTAISPAIGTVTTVTNAVAAINAIPGIIAGTGNLGSALTSLRSSGNQKKLFQDTVVTTYAQTIQTAGGNEDLAIFYHSMNLQSYTVSTQAQLSAACLSEYFTDLFNLGIGMKPISSMQLSGQPVDATITTANIGQPGSAGSSTNLIGWNNNLYPGFGAPPGIGLVQYGYTSNSMASAQVYIDEVVGADFIQFTVQAALVNLIIQAQPTGGLLYNDFGIQQLVSTFKNAIQLAVTQNVLQQPENSAFTWLNYAQMQAQYPAQIANRQYNELFFAGNFLSRIQMIQVNVNLSL